MPSPNVPPWHANYCELKPIKSQKTQEEFFISPLTQKNLDKGPGPRTKLTLEIDKYEVWGRCGKLGGVQQGLFVWIPLCVSRWHGKYLFTKHLLFSFSCELSSFSLKPQTPTPILLNSGCHIRLNYCTVFEPLMSMWGSHIYKNKFVFFLLICLTSI